MSAFAQTIFQGDGGAMTTPLLNAVKAIIDNPPMGLPPQAGITAHAGGGQPGAFQLTLGLNQIATVVTAADSVVLPKAAPGNMVVVSNAAAANSANVFPYPNDAINVLGVNVAFPLAANKVAIFFCFVSGLWNSVLTA